jgi:hypothetical protein
VQHATSTVLSFFDTFAQAPNVHHPDADPEIENAAFQASTEEPHTLFTPVAASI